LTLEEEVRQADRGEEVAGERHLDIVIRVVVVELERSHP